MHLPPGLCCHVVRICSVIQESLDDPWIASHGCKAQGRPTAMVPLQCASETIPWPGMDRAACSRKQQVFLIPKTIYYVILYFILYNIILYYIILYYIILYYIILYYIILYYIILYYIILYYIILYYIIL